MNIKHETFIREMIAHGDRRRAYFTAYPSSSLNAAYANACRLLKRPEISKRITDGINIAEKQAYAILLSKDTDDIIDILHKRLSLARIVRGQIPDEEIVVGDGQVYHIRKTPSISQILRALDLDRKLERQFRKTA